MIDSKSFGLVIVASIFCVHGSAEENTAGGKGLPGDGVGFINDMMVVREAERHVNRMIKDDEATLCSDLFTQLDRTECNLALATPKKKNRPLSKLYVDACKSIVVIMISRKHNDHWHINPAATGFVVASDGIIATNYHVIRDDSEYCFAMTSDGRVHSVVEVLAGNEANDAVLLRIDADSLRPIPLIEGTPVGADIRVVSHPKGRFYSLSEGIVSRRYVRPPGKRPRDDESEEETGDVRAATRWVTVTADFGGGSSGAPVLDRAGNAIAMATSTNGVEAGKGERKTVQMVFRDCVPTEVILQLIANDQ